MYTSHIHSERNRNKLLTKIEILAFSFIFSIVFDWIVSLSLPCFNWNSLSHQQSQSKARFLAFAHVFSLTHIESRTYQRGLNSQQVSETFPHVFDLVHLESPTYQSEVNFHEVLATHSAFEVRFAVVCCTPWLHSGSANNGRWK